MESDTKRSEADPSADPLARVAVALVALVVLSLGVRVLMLSRTPFIMDEMVDLQLALQVSDGVVLYRDQPWERMPLMTLVLSAWADGLPSFDALVRARWLFWFATVWMFAGVGWAARRMFDASHAASAMFLLAGFSTFLDRSIRIRADVLATAASLVALLLLTGPTFTYAGALVSGLCLGIAFLTTQKAAYFAIAYGVALTARCLVERDQAGSGVLRWLGLSAASAGGFSIPVAAGFAWAASTCGVGPFIDNVFLTGAQTGLVADSYAGTWIFIIQTVGRSPMFWCLGTAGIVVGLVESLRNETGRRGPAMALAVFALVITLLILRHTAKFPYVFVNVAPALALAGAVPFTRGMRMALTPGSSPLWHNSVVVCGFVLFLVATPAWHHLRNLNAQELTEKQYKVMEAVEAMTEPEDAVFDGVGTVVTRRKATPWAIHLRWADERAAGADYDVIGEIERSAPVVWLHNYRMHFLRPEELEYLETHFVPWWSNIWVVGARIDVAVPDVPVEVQLLAEADYSVRTEPEGVEVRVDGRQMGASPVRLSRGTVRVEASRPCTLTLQLAAAAQRTPPETDPLSTVLYPTYED